MAAVAVAAIAGTTATAQAFVMHTNTPITNLASKLSFYQVNALPGGINDIHSGGSGKSTDSSLRRDGRSVVFVTEAKDLTEFGRVHITPIADDGSQVKPRGFTDICLKFLDHPLPTTTSGKVDLADGQLLCPIRSKLYGEHLLRGDPPNTNLSNPVATNAGVIFRAESPAASSDADIGLTKPISPVHIQQKDDAGKVVRDYDIHRLPSASHVYYWDQLTGDQELISVNTKNQPATAFNTDGSERKAPNAPAHSGLTSAGPALDASADGRFVVFASDAENLALDASGMPLRNAAGQPFNVTGTHIYLRDRKRGTTQLVDFNSQGRVGRPQGFTSPDGQSVEPTVSDDGQWIAFSASYPGFTDEVGNDTQYRVFLRHCPLSGDTPDCNSKAEGAKATTFLVSKRLDGTPARGRRPSISADGRRLAYLSDAQGIVRTEIPVPGDQIYWAQCDPGGRYHDCRTITHRLVTHKFGKPAVPVSGMVGQNFELSANGGNIAYTARVDNVLSDPPVYQYSLSDHIYLWRARFSGGQLTFDRTFPVDRKTPVLDGQWLDGSGASLNQFPFGPLVPDFNSNSPSVSEDGRYVTWQSAGEYTYSNVRPKDPFRQNYIDVWRRDMQGYTTRVPSPAEDATWGNRPRPRRTGNRPEPVRPRTTQAPSPGGERPIVRAPLPRFDAGTEVVP